MKILLLSLITFAALTLNPAPASAEVEISVTPNVITVKIKNTATGQVLFLKQEPGAPFTTMLKPCPGDQKYDCLYEIKKGKKDRKLYAYKAAVSMMVIYVTETKIAVRP